MNSHEADMVQTAGIPASSRWTPTQLTHPIAQTARRPAGWMAIRPHRTRCAVRHRRSPVPGQAEQHGLERVMSERQEQPIAEQSTPDQRAQPAIKQLSTEQQDQRNTVQLTPERRAQPAIRHLATETAGISTPPERPAPEQRDQPAIKQLATEQQDQRTAVQLTPERRAQPAIGQRADCQDSTARPDARRGATKQGLRSARRRIERALDRYGYYMAVGVCALMVFAGALIGTSGNAPSATPQSTQLTGEQVSDVPAEQPSSGDGLLGEDVSAKRGCHPGDAAPHSLACWPLEGQVLTAHSLDALIYQPTLGVYATHAGHRHCGQRRPGRGGMRRWRGRAVAGASRCWATS